MSDHPLPDLLVEVEWNAPSAVRVRAGQLEWKRGRELVADFPHPEDVGDSLLDGFVALEHASDDDIAAYARQYGVLRLCPHAHPAPYGRPTCHVPDCPGVRDPASSRGWFTEPIDGWRQWAARLRAWRRL